MGWATGRIEALQQGKIVPRCQPIEGKIRKIEA